MTDDIKTYLWLAAYLLSPASTAWLIKSINELRRDVQELGKTVEHDRGLFEGMDLDTRVTRLELAQRPLSALEDRPARQPF